MEVKDHQYHVVPPPSAAAKATPDGGEENYSRSSYKISRFLFAFLKKTLAMVIDLPGESTDLFKDDLNCHDAVAAKTPW